MSKVVIKVFTEEEKRMEFKHLCSKPENVKQGKGDMQKVLESYIDRCLEKDKLV